MSELAVVGTIERIFDEVQVTEKFKKREFVLCIASGQYTDSVKFQLAQERCSLLDKHNLNDRVKVYFNLKGRVYNKNSEDMYFNTLNAWRISTNTEDSETAKVEQPKAEAKPTAPAPTKPAPKQATAVVDDSGFDDLPF